MILAEKIFNQLFTARNFNTLPLTISSLQGDLYDYELITFFGPSSASTDLLITLNSDTTANYREYNMLGAASSALATVTDSNVNVGLDDIPHSTNSSFLKARITGSSGDERYLDIFYGTSTNRVFKTSGYWKNTANEVDEITLKFSTSVTADAHIILYRTPKVASQAGWELMETKTFTNADLFNSPVSFTGLDGDRDKVYKIDLYNFSNNATILPEFTINADTGSNYTEQRIQNNGGSIAAANTARSAILTSASTMNFVNFSMIINAESGVKRLVTSSTGLTANIEQQESSVWWTNTADNITTIELFDASTNSDIDGYAKLYRKINPKSTADTLNFETIKTVSISGDFSAGHTFSNLKGDSTTLYKLEFLGETDASGTTWIRAQINGDTTSNYIHQYLRSYASVADAVNVTYPYINFMHNFIGGIEEMGTIECYIYPRSGADRPMLSKSAVEHIAGVQWSTNHVATWWGNSADEVTSIKVFGSNSNALTGTLKLSRLK